MPISHKGSERRKARVRKAIRARAYGRPRLSVHRSGKNIYAQVIDDASGRTLAAASSLDKDVKGKANGGSTEGAAVVGRLVAERAKAANVSEVVFDRGGYLYHGRVKALAEAAREAGHAVTLISGPVNLPAPADMTLVRVETARQMFEAVQTHLDGQDVAIFAAAVADYRPAHPAAHKLKKTEPTLTLTLERTEDILGSARQPFGFRGYLVGFAAETERLVEHAQDKLVRKGCDLIIANDVSQSGIGFDSAENAVTLCLPDGQTIHLPRQPKTTLARELIAFIAARVALKPTLPASNPG